MSLRTSLFRTSAFAPMLALATLAVACSSGPAPNTFGVVDGGTDPDADPFQDPDANFKPGDGAVPPPVCAPDPGNYDVPGNNCDDDGDGQIDNVTPCDSSLAIAGPAADFAKAIGLCKGVLSATYTQGFGSNKAPDPNQHGILNKFGNVIKPREGAAMGALSSGWAREYDQCFGQTTGPFKGGCDMTGVGTAPPGYPKAASGCAGASDVNDVSTVKLVIKVPNNAKGLSFDFNFFSGEWPEFVCTSFNDAFIAYLKSTAFKSGTADNISFDSKNNPVSVNNGFFDRCSPGSGLNCSNFPSGYKYCAGGDSELKGTGFYVPQDSCFVGKTDSGGGGTGWLTTKAPVAGGETITLEFMIWDTGDQAYDSSVLIDKFNWEGSDTTVGTFRPPT